MPPARFMSPGRFMSPAGSMIVAVTAVLLSAGGASAQALPHSWLFGTWTGGLFPVTPGGIAEACRTPTVMFSKDAVARSSLIDPAFTPRAIETVRANPKSAEFRLTATTPAAMSTSAETDAGFGCENPDVLHVARAGENEISFPGCADFPNPLVRCPGR